MDLARNHGSGLGTGFHPWELLVPVRDGGGGLPPPEPVVPPLAWIGESRPVPSAAGISRPGLKKQRFVAELCQMFPLNRKQR